MSGTAKDEFNSKISRIRAATRSNYYIILYLKENLIRFYYRTYLWLNCSQVTILCSHTTKMTSLHVVVSHYEGLKTLLLVSLQTAMCTSSTQYSDDAKSKGSHKCVLKSIVGTYAG